MFLRMVLPILGIFAGYYLGDFHTIPTDRIAGELITTISTVAQISATMMGFMLTALAILASISTKNLTSNMISQGHYPDLVNHLSLAALTYFLLFVCSMAILFTGDFQSFTKNLMLGLACGSIIATIQVIYKLWFVLKNT